MKTQHQTAVVPQELQRSPLLRALLEAFPGGVGLVSPEGSLLYGNQELERLLGGALPLERPLSPRGELYQLSEPEGTPLPEEAWPLSRALAGEPARRLALRLEHATGRRLEVGCSLVPLVAEGGQPLGALFLLEDMTQERALDRQRARFISVLGHELKNPLAAIRFSAEALKMKLKLPQQDPKQQAIDRIVTCVERMARMTEEVLDHSRVETKGGIPISPERCDLGVIVKEAVELARVRYPDHPIRLSLEGPVDGIWDPERLDQALSNLIGNAAKYSPPGAPIEVEVKGEGEEVAVLVRDQGIGIRAEERPSIFRPFFRSERAAQLSAAGLGLGLSITYEIVRRHQGKITVESEEDKGSTFRFVLPRHALSAD